MNPIRPLDLVRLKHEHRCVERVVRVEVEHALIAQELCPGFVVCGWVPLEFLELVPGQIERLAA